MWFGPIPVQEDGYSVEAALKGVLFDAVQVGGEVDVQQLLLYCCDSPAKAFGVLGFQTQAMLSIDGLYDLFHREPPPTGLELPDYTDPFSRPTLQRLFTLLKLSEAERTPYALVKAHPMGAALFEACISYSPKDVYGLVSKQLGNAGQALKL